jgi:uncharacterized protein YndB with AHSA1/START domain
MEPKITQTHSAFALTCQVSVTINANAQVVWKILTDAQDFPRWNSTITSIEGQIREGEKLVIRAPGASRTFTPTVSGVVPNERMIWSGGFAPMFKGVRTFELRSRTGRALKWALTHGLTDRSD